MSCELILFTSVNNERVFDSMESFVSFFYYLSNSCCFEIIDKMGKSDKFFTNDCIFPWLNFNPILFNPNIFIPDTILFGELLLVGSNVEKWGDHQKRKLFISNSFEALIQLQEEHQGLLKLHVH